MWPVPSSRDTVVTCNSYVPPCCPVGLSWFVFSAAASEEERHDDRPNVSVGIKLTISVLNPVLKVF